MRKFVIVRKKKNMKLRSNRGEWWLEIRRIAARSNDFPKTDPNDMNFHQSARFGLDHLPKPRPTSTRERFLRDKFNSLAYIASVAKAGVIIALIVNRLLYSLASHAKSRCDIDSVNKMFVQSLANESVARDTFVRSKRKIFCRCVDLNTSKLSIIDQVQLARILPCHLFILRDVRFRLSLALKHTFRITFLSFSLSFIVNQSFRCCFMRCGSVFLMWLAKCAKQRK